MNKEKISITKDGDQWCVLWGENIAEGIAGFGDTIEDAMRSFMYEALYGNKWTETFGHRLILIPRKGSEIKGIGPDMIIQDDLDPAMAGNHIKGYMGTRLVFIDGKQLSPRRSQEVYNHSPAGFNWGYNGSGPAQLALAILLEFTDKNTAFAIYQEFKDEHVAIWPQTGFDVRINIAGWIKSKINKAGRKTIDT